MPEAVCKVPSLLDWSFTVVDHGSLLFEGTSFEKPED